jgi:predicted enzyme related to lactoylglutathione lyase
MHLNHVTLPAHDLAASRAFYLAIGLRLIVLAEPRYARFEMPGGDAHPSTLSIEVTADGRAGSAEIMLACDNVDAAHSAATAAGVAFDWPPADQSYGWRTAGTTDPAGNRIVLYTAGANHRFPPWRLASP